MAGTLLVRGGGTLYWLEDGRRVVAREPLDGSPRHAAEHVALDYRDVPAARRLGWARRFAPLRAEPALARALRAVGAEVEVADAASLRKARERLPAVPPEELRRVLLPLATASARELLRGPDETLIALAREEARLERALGRETGARAQWVAAPDGPLADHAAEAVRFAEAYRRHHALLEARLEEAARAHVPNLASLVGPKVAGRLVAAAGSRRALARVSGSRLQLLGARRRPDPERGPRFGVLYRAPGIEELSDELRGAFARSLAALAAIAVRADEHTGADLSASLGARRARRLAQLRARRP